MMLIYSENGNRAVILNHTPPAANLVSCSDKWAVMQCLCGLSRLIFQHISRQGTLRTLREFHQIISILTTKLMAQTQWVITLLMDLSSAVLTKSHYTCFHHLPKLHFYWIFVRLKKHKENFNSLKIDGFFFLGFETLRSSF